MRFLVFLILSSALCLAQTGSLTAPVPQSQGEEYRVYTEHPRLFLRPQRLRLLKRERERESMRWRQFETLMTAKADVPEPGFALALYYKVAADQSAGKRAIDWALNTGSDLRQLAFVYDWCQDLLSESQSKALELKIRKALNATKGDSIASERDRVLAAISIAEQDQDATEAVLHAAVGTWWRKGMAVRIRDGFDPDPGPEMQALIELLHGVRDNLTIDLREDAADYFKTLAAYEVISNYPAPYPAAENEYRIPIYNSMGEPDLNRAALSRAAGLATVAYDTNLTENQFLQGWLIQDRFIMKGTFGAPYEFLWANPYQPGLSYAHLPVIFHDKRSGALFLRSSWDEDAVWFALREGQAQLFREGKITVLQTKRGQDKPVLIEVGDAGVVVSQDHLRFQANAEHVFVIGGKPMANYDVEIDDQEMTETATDKAGTLALEFDPNQSPGVRLRETLVVR